MYCTVAATVQSEPNFVGFSHKHKGIVAHSVHMFLVLNSCSQTAHMISVFKKYRNCGLSYVCPMFAENEFTMHQGCAICEWRSASTAYSCIPGLRQNVKSGLFSIFSGS